ncbi:MAG: spore germination protein [bacterium]
MELRRRLEENLDYLREEMGLGESLDVVSRHISVGGREAALVFIDGFAKDQVLLRILQILQGLPRERLAPSPIKKLLASYIGYIEVETISSLEDIPKTVLAGPVVLIIDGEREAIAIDAREYPARGPEEPDIERVTRGSRDGFTETLVFNTALIRRRIRDPKLRVELQQAGKRSLSDIAVVYIKDVADPGLVTLLKERLKTIDIDGLPMAEKSVEEFLTLGTWNPFPQVRYTERPDVAAVHILEGHVLILVDTSPSAIIAPATLFHHLQHAEEFRQNALAGAYLRWVRFFGITASLIVTPLWLLFALHPDAMPSSLRFIGPRELGRVPLFLQFIFAEIGLDLVRMAAIHTPNSLATALGIIAAFMIGDFATKVGLLIPEVVVYMAIAAVGTFATPSYEFGMAVRLARLLLLLLGGLGGVIGLAVGMFLLLVRLMTTKSFNVPYLWPLLPFDGAALLDILLRQPVPMKRFRPRALQPQDPDRRPPQKPV